MSDASGGPKWGSPLGWVLTLIGIGFAAGFMAYCLDRYHILATWTRGEAEVVRWIPYWEDSEGRNTRIEGDPIAAEGKSHQHLSYSAVAMLPLSNGDTLRYEEGPGYYNSRPAATVKFRVYYTLGPPVDYFQYSLLRCWGPAMMLLLPAVGLTWFGLHLVLGARKSAPSKPVHEPYHPV